MRHVVALAQHLHVLARHLAILEDEVALRAATDQVLAVLLLQEELVAERSFPRRPGCAAPPCGAARPACGNVTSTSGEGGRRLGSLPSTREDDAADLDLVARHDEAARPGIERDVADRAVGPERDERDLADLRVLLVDARDVDADLARLPHARSSGRPVRARCVASRESSRREARLRYTRRLVSHASPSCPSTPDGSIAAARHFRPRRPRANLARPEAARDTFTHESRIGSLRRRPPAPSQRRPARGPPLSAHRDTVAGRARRDRRRRRLRGRRRGRRVVARLRGARRLCAASRRGQLGQHDRHGDRPASTRSGGTSRSARSSIGGQEVLLCARRQRRGEGRDAGEGVERDLDQAAAGISRILERAAA